jgi:hypothetical protein
MTRLAQRKVERAKAVLRSGWRSEPNSSGSELRILGKEKPNQPNTTFATAEATANPFVNSLQVLRLQ